MNREKIIAWAVMKNGECLSVRRFEPVASGEANDVEFVPLGRLTEQPAQQCWCTTCRPITMNDMRFVVCPDCGNKRCPKANDHRNACTGSNAVGQKGSSWEHVRPVGEQPAQQECASPMACSGVDKCVYRAEPAQQEPVAYYGIIDPDYARVFTMARCLAWAEGYALAMHGSFTRDLDMIAVPWTDAECNPQTLVARIADAADLKVNGAPGQKPHGRLAFTLLFKGFADPRFIDLSVMPRPQARELNEADELLRKLGLDPDRFRTEGGYINHMKVRAAIQHPDEYAAAMLPMYRKLTNCVVCGRLNPKEGECDHGGEVCPKMREPLTDDEIWNFWWSRPEVPEGEDDSMEAEFVAAVRAVLAAHGIGEKK